jgi:hypothetical protein
LTAVRIVGGDEARRIREAKGDAADFGRHITDHGPAYRKPLDSLLVLQNVDVVEIAFEAGCQRRLQAGPGGEAGDAGDMGCGGGCS